LSGRLKKKMEKIQAKYRELFLNNTLGQDVLADILQLCKFGCTLDPDNKVQVAEYNLGVIILHRCGIFAEDTLENVIRALANVVPLSKED